MIYILLIALIIMFIISYIFTGKDIFTPSTIQILTFVMSAAMCMYFMLVLDSPHYFDIFTVGIVVSLMSLTLGIGIIVHRIFTKIKIQPHTNKTVHISPVSTNTNIIFIIIIIITIIWHLLEIKRIGGASVDFLETMSRYRSINSYSTAESGRLPWLLNQLITLTKAIFIISVFNIVCFYNEISVTRIIMGIVLILLCALELLLTGARMVLLNLIIACAVMLHLLNIQKNGTYKKYNSKTIFTAFVTVIAIFAAFYLLRYFVGRSVSYATKLDPIEYIAYYTGSPLILLDEYLLNPPPASDIFGKQTFATLNRFLIDHNLIDVDPYISHMEFRNVAPGILGNVYTFIRVYHYDFGIIGMYALHIVCVAFYSIYYEYAKKQRGNINIIIFSLIYFGIVMSFYTDRFYIEVLSPAFIKLIIFVLILYEIIIRKRLRISINSKAVKILKCK